MTRPRLLLVDDAPDMALILARVARRAGFDFASRADARGALEFLGQSTPDLTLLDVNLPGMSGVELLKRLRGQAQSVRLRVALFCQPGLSGDIAAGWKAGADYLTSKELVSQPDSLQERLVEILAHTHGQPPGGSLTCPATTAGSITCDWSAMERVLNLPAAQALGSEVLEQVLHRALNFLPSPSLLERGSWVTPGEGRLVLATLPTAMARRAMFECFASLADQLWCLLGKDAGPLNEALQAAVDRLLG